MENAPSRPSDSGTRPPSTGRGVGRGLLALATLVAVGALAWQLPRTREPDEGAEPPSATSAPVEKPGTLAAAPHPSIVVAHLGRGSIVGRVRDERGDPVAALVEVTRSSAFRPGRPLPRGATNVLEESTLEELEPRPPDARVQCEADGRFEVRGLGAGMYMLAASTTSGAGGRAVTSVNEGEEARKDVTVLAAGSHVLRGRVVHADGTPWSDAVAVWSTTPALPREGPLLRPAIDADGRFVVSGLASRRAIVAAVRRDPFFFDQTDVVFEDGVEWVFVVDKGLVATPLRVVASDDGAPVAGAVVRSFGTDASAAKARQTTDADGRCVILVEAGEHGAVSVFAEGYLERRSVDVHPGTQNEARLERGARVEGRVVSAADGTPVAGITVYAASAAKYGWEFPAPLPATTDTAGRFAFAGLEPGDAMFVAEGMGFTTSGLADLRSDGFNPFAISLAAGKATTVEVTVVRGAVLEGTVMDASGSPVANATVEWSRSDELSVPSYRPHGMFGRDPSASTDAEGRFRFESLPLSIAVELAATAPGHARIRQTVRTAASGRSPGVRLQFRAERWIDVTVLDAATGKPVADVDFGAWWRRLGRTGSNGKAHVGPIDDDEVDVEAQGYLATHVAADAGTATVRLVRGVSLTGRVQWPDGSAAVAASVELETSGGSIFQQIKRMPFASQFTHTDDDGRFELPGLTAEPTPVSAALERDGGPWVAEANVTPGATPVTLTLARDERKTRQRSTSMVLRVVGPDGKPVPRAEGTYLRGDGESTFAVVDGRAELDDPSNDGPIVAWGAKTAAGEPLPYAPTRLDVDSASGGSLELRMTTDVPIEGRVHDESGRGVARVVVVAERKDDPEDAKSRGKKRRARPDPISSRTRADGSFRLVGLGDGAYEVTFAVPTDFVAPESLTVSAGARPLDVTLRSSSGARVSVFDYEGKPVVGAPVEIEDVAGAVTDESGVALLARLDLRASYKLSVDAPDDRDDLRPTTIADFSAHDRDVRLERGYSIEGVVRSKDGRPVGSAYVSTRSDEEHRVPHHFERVRHDGTFKLRGFAAGPVRLEAQPSGAGAPRSKHASAVVQAGARDVVLVLDVGATLSIVVENWPAGTMSAEAGVCPAPPLPFDWEATATQHVNEDGRVSFSGLDEGVRYTLGIKPVGDLHLVQPGMRPGPDDVRVRLVPGKTIHGRVTLPPGATDVRVYAELGEADVLIRGELLDDGTYRIRGLPDAPWKVSIMATKDGEKWEAEAPVAAGGTADLVLEKRRNADGESGK